MTEYGKSIVHGHWIDVNGLYICSVCNSLVSMESTGFTEFDLFTYKYCPHCGAIMDEREEDDREAR